MVWDLNLPAAQPGRRRAAARAQGGGAAWRTSSPAPSRSTRIAAQAREALAEARIWQEFRARAEQARGYAEAVLGELHLPQMPSLEQVRRLAEDRLARTPSLDEIARRTRQVMLETTASAVAQGDLSRLVPAPGQPGSTPAGPPRPRSGQ